MQPLPLVQVAIAKGIGTKPVSFTINKAAVVLITGNRRPAAIACHLVFTPSPLIPVTIGVFVQPKAMTLSLDELAFKYRKNTWGLGC